MSTKTEMAPSNADIQAYLKSIKANPLVSVKNLGRSKGKRQIPLVIISDKSVSDLDKQQVLVVGGRHGNEESGRAQALKLIEWLISSAGSSILKKQNIYVMPIANPDGAADDIYKNLDGVNPFLDIESHEVAAEGKAFEAVLQITQPDLFIDLHAKGHCGYNYDMILHPAQRVYTEDFFMIWDMMREMADAGEKIGVPHEIHSMEWPGWNDRGPCAICYDRYKSISLLTETSESNQGCIPLEKRAMVGFARIKAALQWGQKRHHKLPYAGYPNHLVGASFYLGIVALGHNATERRNNRIQIWSQLDHFKRLANQLPEEELFKICHLDYQGEPLGQSCGIQIQTSGKRKIKSILLNGLEIPRDSKSLYQTWKNANSTFVLVPIPDLQRGQYEIRISYQ